MARVWFMKSFPMFGFAGVAVTGMILGKLLGRRSIHIIDMGQGMTAQWPYFFRLLAQQPGQPLKQIRFTWLDSMFLMNPGHTSYNATESGLTLSRGLQRVAEAAGIGFTFQHVTVDRRSMQVLYEVRRRAQDTLVVTASLNLMHYPGDATAGGRRQLLLEVQSGNPHYSIVLYSTVLYSIVLYSIVLYSAMHPGTATAGARRQLLLGACAVQHSTVQYDLLLSLPYHQICALHRVE